MSTGFDDTQVREVGLERNPFYNSLSSIEFALFVMFLIGVATLLGALFPQGMDETFYLARFGERLFHIYDSLGVFGVLRSWWFMLLFLLLLVALVFCSHARARQRAFRVVKGTTLFETEFSIPTPTEDVLLIFPVLLRSIGFRRKRIITGERRSEVTAVRGISPSANSLLLHVSAAVLLLGLLCSYLFSWGCSVPQEEGKTLTIPSGAQETRWAKLKGSLSSGEHTLEKDGYLTMELLEFVRHYKPAPTPLAVAPVSPFLSPSAIPFEQLFVTQEAKDLLLDGWGSSLRLSRGGRVETLHVATGKSGVAFGLHISQGPFSEVASIGFSSVGETLQVVLPADVSLAGVRFSLVPSPVTDEGDAVDSGDSGTSSSRTVRIIALPAKEGDGRLSEIQEQTADLSVGEQVNLAGLPVKVLGLSEKSVIRVRFDPGRTFVKLGTLLVVLFATLRLYMYWYMLRIELAATKGGGSHLRLRIGAAGLLSSPQRVARKIASLLAK